MALNVWQAEGYEIAEVDVLGEAGVIGEEVVCEIEVKNLLEGANIFKFEKPLEVGDIRKVAKGNIIPVHFKK